MGIRKSIFYFCKADSAPQYMALSGKGTSSESFSGLTTLRYSSCPRYHESRFSARRFQIPLLSSETKIAVQAPGKTCGYVKLKSTSDMNAIIFFFHLYQDQTNTILFLVYMLFFSICFNDSLSLNYIPRKHIMY